MWDPRTAREAPEAKLDEAIQLLADLRCSVTSVIAKRADWRQLDSGERIACWRAVAAWPISARLRHRPDRTWCVRAGFSPSSGRERVDHCDRDNRIDANVQRAHPIVARGLPHDPPRSALARRQARRRVPAKPARLGQTQDLRFRLGLALPAARRNVGMPADVGCDVAILTPAPTRAGPRALRSTFR